MKILIKRFRKNDLKSNNEGSPDNGKQVELGKAFFDNLLDSNVNEFDINYRGSTKFHFKLSELTDRGDRKIYLAQGTISLKEFFCKYDNGCLTPNVDFWVLTKSDDGYGLDIIKHDSAIGRCLSPLIKKGKAAVIDTENVYLPYNRIIFGAPGTGKSYLLSKDAELGLFNKELDEKNLSPLEYDIANGLWHIRQCGTISDDTEQKELQDPEEQDSEKSDQMDSGINVERVTFYPNYSYAQFVGSYKPIMKKMGKKEEISYEFIPGPFIRTLVNALKNPLQKHLLIIDEINRTNAAATFGDAFQLLDRNKKGESEYPINTSEDLKKYLAQELKENCSKKSQEKKISAEEKYSQISIPSNMFIWATMNSADQGVFPIDTAFKRRWQFEYIGINENKEKIKDFFIPTHHTSEGYILVNWDHLRRAINKKLSEEGVNEDKFLGPFFINMDYLERTNRFAQSFKDAGQISTSFPGVNISKKTFQCTESAEKELDAFVDMFKSKVLMYLYEDMRLCRPKIFNLSKEKRSLYDINADFRRNGIEVFSFIKK